MFGTTQYGVYSVPEELKVKLMSMLKRGSHRNILKKLGYAISAQI